MMSSFVTFLILVIAPQIWLSITLVDGLFVVGAIFAVNRSLHSYLVRAFSNAERATMDAGFSYMANTGGRLPGIVLYGLTDQVRGLAPMLGTVSAMVAISALAMGRLGTANRKDNSA